MADPVVRITVNVSPEVAGQLEDLANKMHTTKTQAINQAIATTAAIYEAESRGGQAVIKHGNTQQPITLAKQATP
jgi:predicted transcriptional regulator